MRKIFWRHNITNEIEPIPAPQFAVTDRSSADWVLSKIKAESQKQADIEAWAKREIERSKQREASLMERFAVQLDQFRQANLEHGRKSVALPSGTIGTRAQKTKLVVANEEECLEWCRLHLPEAVHVQVKVELGEWRRVMYAVTTVSGTENILVKAAIDAHFKTTGEVPPGTDVVTAWDKFYIETPISTPQFAETPELPEPEEEDEP